MGIFQSKVNKWMQKKILGANHLFAEYLSDYFSYINRAEYLNHCVLNSNASGISSEKYCSTEVIVSLTTYDRRLYEVYLAIESIMQQTLKPNKIILWLADELKNNDMPKTLKKQQDRGLEIKYCKDILSYKKLIPALKEFPSAVIITIDDDHLYHFDIVENLIAAHNKKPTLVFGAAMRRMKLLHKNKLEKYSKWARHESFDISPLNFSVGMGGVLYPPNCLNEEVFNENVFMDICKYADDTWFKSMALLNGTMAQKVLTHINFAKEHLRNNSTQHTTLTTINKSMNDIQLKAVFDKYSLYDLLSE